MSPGEAILTIAPITDAVKTFPSYVSSLVPHDPERANHKLYPAWTIYQRHRIHSWCIHNNLKEIFSGWPLSFSRFRYPRALLPHPPNNNASLQRRREISLSDQPLAIFIIACIIQIHGVHITQQSEFQDLLLIRWLLQPPPVSALLLPLIYIAAPCPCCCCPQLPLLRQRF